MLLIEKLKNIEVVELTEVVELPIKAEGVIVGFAQVLSISLKARTSSP